MSHEFVEVPIKSIRLHRNRQRKDFKGISELADSINRNGLMHPIIIDRQNFLVAGERRLKAHKELGREVIQVHYLDQLDSFEARAIELEENIKRVDLSWKESCLATADYHALRVKADPEWTKAKTAEAIGLSPQHVSRLLSVAVGLIEKDEAVTRAAKRSIDRKRKRALDTELSRIDIAATIKDDPSPEAKARAKEGLMEMVGKTAPSETVAVQADFLEWAKSYDGHKFNFVHCDFPYGVKYGTTTYGGSATWPKYGDDPALFAALLECLISNQDRIFLKSAHFMFWFSMNYYTEVLCSFKDAGFRVNPFPLIWAKDKGLIPDHRREGRRVYETAIFGSLGDRKVLLSAPNLIYNQVKKTTHISEKPMPVLEHFFRMFVDEHSYVFDPTCGSGNALAVAKKLGAKHLLGLDIEAEHVKSTNMLVERMEEE
jgi:ParB family chromosome partitioning protein